MFEKRAFQNGFCFLLSIILTAAFMSGCGTGRSHHESVKFDPDFDNEFSSRSQPAQISTATEEDLSQKGYIKLGDLSVELTVERCIKWNNECTPISHKQDSTQTLLAKAAGKGADLVVLKDNKKKRKSDIKVKGACASGIDWYDVGQVAKGYRPDPICYGYEYSDVTVFTETSEGSLWRKEMKKAQEIRLTKVFIKDIENGEIQKVKDYLAQGIDVNSKLDKNSYTLLQIAAGAGQVEMVEVLLARGADPNMTGGIYKSTPLHVTAEMGQVKIVKLLLDKGANPNIGNRFKDTPLHYAARERQIETIKLLLDKGVDPNIQGQYGFTPIYEGGNIEISKLLLAKGADLNNVAWLYGTPLHAAAKNGWVQGVKIWLDLGAEINIKNNDGKTPLDLAIEERKKKAAELLENRGGKSRWSRTGN